MAETHYSYLNSSVVGDHRYYAIDFRKRTMRLIPYGRREYRKLKYISPIDPWYVILPIWIIGWLFFRSNPTWSWRLTEIKQEQQQYDYFNSGKEAGRQSQLTHY